MHCCKRRIPRKQILFFKIGVVTTFLPQVIIHTSMILPTHMARVTDTATLMGKADNLYVAWKGYDTIATGMKK